jgi:hypothetical protein
MIRSNSKEGFEKKAIVICLKVFSLPHLEDCNICLLLAFLSCSKSQHLLFQSEECRLSLHVLTWILLYARICKLFNCFTKISQLYSWPIFKPSNSSLCLGISQWRRMKNGGKVPRIYGYEWSSQVCSDWMRPVRVAGEVTKIRTPVLSENLAPVTLFLSIACCVCWTGNKQMHVHTLCGCLSSTSAFMSCWCRSVSQAALTRM